MNPWLYQLRQQLHGSSQWWRDLSSRHFRMGKLRQWELDSHQSLYWLGLIAGLALLLVLNWRLGLALLLGMAVMLTAYGLQTPAGREARRHLHHLWSSGSRLPLVGTVGAGGVAALASYTALSIWAESEHRWMATGALVQGMGTLALVLFLFWDVWQRRGERRQEDLDRWLRDVAAPESLKRLLAVRRLQKLLDPHLADPDQLNLAIESLRLAIEQESVPLVREAMLDALQGWGIRQRLRLP